mmetsp:Transcript_17385/g.19465  ORF Transcript_17385/g.19465 Transcript_17385/m.19465 type:complete len:201 (+) Transcript_17385:137-739(+)
MNKQQVSCTKSLVSSMTEQRQGTSYGRDFLSTSEGDNYHLELDNDYKNFISEEKISPTRSIQFLLTKHKSPQLRPHPNKIHVSCKKKDTKHRVNSFMHRLSLQMRRRCCPNEDSLLDLLQVKKPSPKTTTFERSPCLVLVRGPTLHPYRTVPNLHPYHTVPTGVLHDHEAVSLHFSSSLIDDDACFLDTIDVNDPNDIRS